MAFGQSPIQQDESGRASVDFRADQMSRIKVGDSTALCLVGHVVFFHNGAVIMCDSAVRYSERLMDCYRNVVVNKDSTFIYGDKADYNGILNEARIYSPLIKMVDKDATLYTRNFIFNTLDNIGRYYGGGTLSQQDNLMESDEGYYYADLREIVGVHNVEMSNPEYMIRSDSVSYNLDSEIATFATRSYIWNDRDEFLTAQKGGRYDRVRAADAECLDVEQGAAVRSETADLCIWRLCPLLGRYGTSFVDSESCFGRL